MKTVIVHESGRLADYLKAKLGLDDVIIKAYVGVDDVRGCIVVTTGVLPLDLMCEAETIVEVHTACPMGYTWNELNDAQMEDAVGVVNKYKVTRL